MKLIPHFSFDSKAKEALEFYITALKGKEEIVYTYKDCVPDLEEENFDKIMYSAFSFGEGNLIAICDMCPGSGPEKSGNIVFMDLELKAKDVKPVFDALKEGGKVLCPLSKTSWTEQFGCLVDKFGVGWNIMEEEKSN